MDADLVYDIAFLANTPTQVQSLQHRMEEQAGNIGLYVNTDKTD